MPSSTSSFNRKLRLPRLFFAEPSEIIPRDYERPIPQIPWRGITVVVVIIVLAATCAWELYCRSLGYRPTLNDNEDLWVMMRRRVQPESVVIIGDSRAWFDVDLDEVQKGMGKRPVQLAMAGSCGYPVLADLTNDESFHGTIICSIVPRLFFAPPGTPPMERSEKAVRRFHNQTLSQRAGEYLAIPLEEHIAFLKQDDLTLEQLLIRLPIPDRPGAVVPPRSPALFPNARSGTACPHDRGVRPAGKIAKHHSTALGAAFYSAAADLHSERCFLRGDRQGDCRAFP
jgi:hypothetical protein